MSDLGRTRCLHCYIRRFAVAQIPAQPIVIFQQRKRLTTPPPGIELPNEPLAGPSLTATVDASRPRSIIFDYVLPDRQDKVHTLRDQRERSLIAEVQKTPQEADDESKHHADPWSVLAITAIRQCLITRQRLPKGFLVAVRPALFPSKDADGDGSLYLVPDDVLNRKFASHKKGKGFYVTCRKDVVEALVEAKGALGAVAAVPNLKMHAGIVGQVEAQLKTRVLQELEILRNRMKGHTPTLKARVNGAFQRRPVLHRLAEDEAKPMLEDGLIPAGIAEGLIALIDVRGIPWPNRDAHTSTPPAATSDGSDGSSRSSVLALATIRALKPTSNTSQNDSASKTPTEHPPLTSSGMDHKSQELSKTASASPSEEPESQSVPPSLPLIPQSSPLLFAIPRYPLAALLPPAQQTSARTFLGDILRLERREAWLAHRASSETRVKSALQAGEAAPPLRSMRVPRSPGVDAVFVDEEDVDKEDTVKPKRLSSDILALYAHPSLTHEGRRAGSLGIQLAMALWRLRLWFGEGWDEFVIDKRGMRM